MKAYDAALKEVDDLNKPAEEFNRKVEISALKKEILDFGPYAVERFDAYRQRSEKERGKPLPGNFKFPSFKTE